MACALFGMAAASLKEQGRPLLNLFLSIYDTSIKIVRWLMWFVCFCYLIFYLEKEELAFTERLTYKYHKYMTPFWSVFHM